ncbi:MAG: minichromosome maintenance protein MCM [Candidatus Aenigmatarchaeota archaeon]
MLVLQTRETKKLEEREISEIKIAFSNFLEEYYLKEIGRIVLNDERRLLIDFSLLEQFDISLAEKFIEYPEEILKVFEDALYDLEPQLKDKVRIRFYNLPKYLEKRISSLRSEHLGKLVVVDGIVKRASEVRPEIYEAIFVCIECKRLVTQIQTERSLKKPIKCPYCGSRTFDIVGEKLYDARWVVIEEPYEVLSGERPSTIMVYLKEDLVDPKLRVKTDPGNRIKVIGILKNIQRKLRKNYGRTMEIFIDAINFETLETEWEDIEISEEDEKKILELAKDPEIFKKLVNSIAPTIYGLEEIKEAILLQMFGGNEKIMPDGTRIRGEIHILLIGEPSTAKSQLLKYVANLMPRAKYVSGSGATAAGLVATVSRDEEFLGGWVLEAGAVVMANKSIVCIDEVEKVKKDDLIALHEAMEQGSISIAKASIVATLPAKTSVLAAGNPKYGRFDPYIPIREQIDIPETLLTRFDLKFALRDVAQRELDEKILEHIRKTRFFETTETFKETIPPILIKKYISYARKNIKPKMTEEALRKLEEFYLETRQKSKESAAISITLRQFEALIRLAEASAKVRLSEFVTEEDAERAIRLMKYSLKQFGFDPELGMIDIDRYEGITTASQRGKIRTIRSIIDELAKVFGNMIPEEEIIKRAKEQGIEDAEEILNKMKLAGELISHKPGFVGKI